MLKARGVLKTLHSFCPIYCISYTSFNLKSSKFLFGSRREIHSESGDSISFEEKILENISNPEIVFNIVDEAKSQNALNQRIIEQCINSCFFIEDKKKAVLLTLEKFQELKKFLEKQSGSAPGEDKSPISLDVYESMIILFTEQGYPEQVFTLFEEMRRRSGIPQFKDEKIFIHLMDACRQVSRPNDAMEILTAMKEYGISPSLESYHALFRNFIQEGMIDTLMFYFEEVMKNGIQITNETLTIILETFCVANNAEFEKAFKGIVTQMQLTPDEQVYNKLLECFCKVTEDYQKALTLYKTMKISGMKVDEDVMVNIISCCGKYKQYVPALELLADVLKMEGHSKLKTNCCNAILHSFAIHGDKRTLDIFQSIKDNEICEVNVETYNAILEYYKQIGEMDKVDDILAEMESNGIQPNAVSYSILFTPTYKLLLRPKIHELLQQK